MNFPIAKFLQAQSKMMAMAVISLAALVLHAVFSWLLIFKLQWGFIKLSLASAVMLCLEVWYFTALILFAGYLKDPEVSVDALSICTNILSWTVMVAFGFNAAISIRVSNELGAGHPRTAKFSILVVVATSFAIGLCLSIILIIFQHDYPKVFTSSDVVRKRVRDLTSLLALCITMDNVQPVLSGDLVGNDGWHNSANFNPLSLDI